VAGVGGRRGAVELTLAWAELSGRMESRAKVVKRILELGLLVTINSDDPGLMRGSLVGHLMGRVQQAVGLTRADVLTLAENSFRSACLLPDEKGAYLASVRFFSGK